MGDAGPNKEEAMALLQLIQDKDAHLMWCAEELSDPKYMPAGWTAFNDPNSKRTFYQNQAEGTTQWEHPAMEFYKGAVFMHRGGKEELEGLAAKDPPTSEEVQDMAEYLGLEDGDTAAVKRVARLAVSAPLPPGWTETLDEGGEPTFKNEMMPPGASRRSTL
eukprot:CAMPEP_0181380840 /NCGR_PEP_ID=MMETSP1106-20121128/19778_1 /TAXON_ID=81844 /ORGANISM="Mantoniella antarctica, Strain SL-175" /LENGTH=161 /DNA_ID=CAMNT_0023499935 /DNA_START=168 /DNA_END=653 /DNA_ORIENTATION=+